MVETSPGHASEPSVIRAISWRDLCPWVLLFRLYRMSLSIQFLVLAYLGAWATSLGWEAASAVILTDYSHSKPAVREFLDLVSVWPESAFEVTGHTLSVAAADELDQPRPALDRSTSAATRLLATTWRRLGHSPMYALVEPVRRLFNPLLSWNELLFYLFGAAWTVFVWSWLGGALVRAAAVRLGRDERVGLRDSLEFAQRKLPSFLGAVLLPLSAIVVVCLPLFLLGILMRLDLGVALAGLLWAPVVLAGFVVSLFAVGILFGWPLMWPTIGTEGSDAFDAISRSYAYTFQRPLHYLGYTTIAATLGFLGWLIVGIFCESVVQFGLWGVGNGAGQTRMAAIRAAVDPTLAAPPVAADATRPAAPKIEATDRAAARGKSEASTATGPSTSLRWGGRWIRFVNRCVMGIQVAYGYSYMWAAATAIYLLLRRDADQTELDDVFLEEDAGVKFGLPSLKLDEAGGASDVVPSPAASSAGSAAASSAERPTVAGTGPASSGAPGGVSPSPSVGTDGAVATDGSTLPRAAADSDSADGPH